MDDTSTLVVMSADVAAYLMARGATLVHASSPHAHTVLFTLAHAKPEWVAAYQQGCRTPDTWVPPPLLMGMRRRVARACTKAQRTASGEYEVPRP